MEGCKRTKGGRKEIKIPFKLNFILGFNDYSVGGKIFPETKDIVMSHWQSVRIYQSFSVGGEFRVGGYVYLVFFSEICSAVAAYKQHTQLTSNPLNLANRWATLLAAEWKRRYFGPSGKDFSLVPVSLSFRHARILLPVRGFWELLHFLIYFISFFIIFLLIPIYIYIYKLSF